MVCLPRHASIQFMPVIHCLAFFYSVLFSNQTAAQWTCPIFLDGVSCARTSKIFFLPRTIAGTDPHKYGWVPLIRQPPMLNVEHFLWWDACSVGTTFTAFDLSWSVTRVNQKQLLLSLLTKLPTALCCCCLSQCWSFQPLLGVPWCFPWKSNINFGRP